MSRLFETTGKLKKSDKRTKILNACADVIEELFGMEVFGIYLNADYNDDNLPHSINIVFKKELKQ